jgi:hypothetical protein
MSQFHVVVTPQWPREWQVDHADEVQRRFRQAINALRTHPRKFTDPASGLSINAHLEVGENHIGYHMDAVFTANAKCKLRLSEMRDLLHLTLHKGTPAEKKRVYLFVRYVPDIKTWVTQYSAKQGVKL